MRTFKLIFFQGISLTSKIIRWWTDSNFSHVGVYINPMKLIEAWKKPKEPPWKMRWMWSNMANHTPNTPYKILAIEVGNEVYNRLMFYFRFMADIQLPYDWKEILRFGLHLERINMNGKFVCSTGVAYVLQRVSKESGKFLLNPYIPYYKISPGELYELLISNKDWYLLEESYT